MNYATQHHSRDNKTARSKKATTAKPTVMRVCRVDAKTKRRKGDTEGQTEIRTDSNAANGFLRNLFLPKLLEPKTVSVCKKTAKTERDFYTSLSRLVAHYHIEPMPTEAFGYPYNIALALHDIQMQLNQKVRNWDEIRLIEDSKKIYLISEERCNAGMSLYYIPVIPLYKWLKNPKRKYAAQLLLSVCSYLYHVADIPYYRQENSYLYWMYEMVTEWIMCDDENEDIPTYISQMKQAEWIGQWMEQKIFNTHNLKQFKQRLDCFGIRDSIDQNCFMLASKAFGLYEQFPKATMYRNAQTGGEADEDDMESIVSMDKYVSFCADGKGLLFQSLFDSVNNELQEYMQVEEPAITKRFDGKEITNGNLDFENRLFDVIEELIYLLNNF